LGGGDFGADGAVSAEGGAFGDDEGGGDEVAADTGFGSELEAIGGGEVAVDESIDDDARRLDRRVAFGAFGDVDFVVGEDFALEGAEDAGGPSAGESALELRLGADDRHLIGARLISFSHLIVPCWSGVQAVPGAKRGVRAWERGGLRGKGPRVGAGRGGTVVFIARSWDSTALWGGGLDAEAVPESHGDLEGDEEDDDPFEDFHASCGLSVGGFGVEAFEGAEFSEDAGVPFGEPHALGGGAIEAGEELVADDFEGVVDAFEECGAVDLELGDASEPSASLGESESSAEAGGWVGHGLVGLVEGVVESVVEEAHFEEFDIDELEDGEGVLGGLIDDDGGVPVDEGGVLASVGDSGGEGVGFLLIGEFAALGAEDSGQVAALLGEERGEGLVGVGGSDLEDEVVLDHVEDDGLCDRGGQDGDEGIDSSASVGEEVVVFAKALAEGEELVEGAVEGYSVGE